MNISFGVPTGTVCHALQFPWEIHYERKYHELMERRVSKNRIVLFRMNHQIWTKAYRSKRTPLDFFLGYIHNLHNMPMDFVKSLLVCELH